MSSPGFAPRRCVRALSRVSRRSDGIAAAFRAFPRVRSLFAGACLALWVRVVLLFSSVRFACLRWLAPYRVRTLPVSRGLPRVVRMRGLSNLCSLRVIAFVRPLRDEGAVARSDAPLDGDRPVRGRVMPSALRLSSALLRRMLRAAAFMPGVYGPSLCKVRVSSQRVAVPRRPRPDAPRPRLRPRLAVFPR